MLTKQNKQEIQKAYSQFLESKSLKPRFGQKQMIAEIARAIGAIEMDAEGKRVNDAGVVAIEAGTGTGKTVAYTLAVLPLAKALGKKVVISTATVALQEQIIYRDLPDVLKHSGFPFRFGLAKGRGRYLCLSKLDLFLNANPQDALFTEVDELSELKDIDEDAYQIKVYESMAKAMLTGDWDGDKDNWKDELSHQVWQPLTSDRNQCTGRRCQHVAQCSFIKSRENLGQVDCIVANHDLVMADLALGGGAILSPPEETIYIFDEAHHLPDIALNHFACNLRLHTALSWLDQSVKTIHDIGKNSSSFIALLDELDVAVASLVQVKPYYAQLKQQVESLCEPLLPVPENEQMPHLRFEHGQIPHDLQLLSLELFKQLVLIQESLSKAHDMIEKQLEDNRSGLSLNELEQLFAVVGLMSATAERHGDVFQAYSRDVADLPDSRWIQLAESSGLIDFDINASPLLASQSLRKFLWQRCFASVLTSATLTALGNFNRIAMHAGLPMTFQSAIVPSPFNYAENASLMVPSLSCEPSDVQGHTEEIAKLLPKLCKGDQGVLVLFSSRKQMNEVYEFLDIDIQGDVILQNELSKQLLIKTHQLAVDDGQRSVIFGLASLAEGIDLPGQYCSHVIIAKLPFSVPNDPVDAALAEWLETQGRNPFMEISLPEASQRLIQACGRLIRTEKDVGRVTLLDKRLLTKRYGRQLINALPPFRKELDVQV